MRALPSLSWAENLEVGLKIAEKAPPLPTIIPGHSVAPVVPCNGLTV